MKLLIKYLDNVVNHFILVTFILVLEFRDEELVLVRVTVVEMVLFFDVLFDAALKAIAFELAFGPREALRLN